jgi:lysophospholipase L1-like esterase
MLSYGTLVVLMSASYCVIAAQISQTPNVDVSVQDKTSDRSTQKTARTIPADGPEIEYAGYVHKEFLLQPGNPRILLARFDRILDMPGKGYRWDNPGVSIRFRTNATEIEATLYYNELHQSKTARDSVGVYSVDGVFKPGWSFRTRQMEVTRQPETISVSFSNGGVAGFHDYELFLPYGDSVDFAGLSVNQEARFEQSKPQPSLRYIAYGDSITHGFAATAIDRTYPFLVGKKKGWETFNLGLAGRSSLPALSDAKSIVSLKPDVVTVLMGGNDWQGGVTLQQYRTDMENLVAGIRAAQPRTPIFLLTPLWVSPSWNPAGRVADLESYRQVVRDIAVARNDPNLHVIEGPDLIDHNPSFFDQIATHPNDAGFAMMAERLAEQLGL